MHIFLFLNYSFIDVVTPVLSQLHLLTIINQLHIMCSREVQKHNQLKKEKVLHLSQLKAQIIEKTQKKSTNAGAKNSKETENIGSSFEETKACHIRTLIKVSKVNIE